MDNILKSFPAIFKKRTASSDKTKFENTDTIIEEIKEVKNQLEEVEAKFNLISDFDLIDALIFEQRSLEEIRLFTAYCKRKRH